MENVEYLYHYTTIEKLALILKNQTIRLNPLDKMDDLQEQKTADVENVGKFVYVSSWTDDETESIPMWKMYTSSASGVRIKLRKNPFLFCSTIGKDFEDKLPMTAANEQTRQGQWTTFLNVAELLAQGAFSPQAHSGKILTQVIYTNDKEKLEPHIYSELGQGFSITFDSLGKYKNLHWEFQKEWRYIMFFIPLNLRVPVEQAQQLFTITANNIRQGTEAPCFPFYDLKIAPEYFAEMEITASPQMTPGNRVLLETIVEKYNPNARIVPSSLTGLI